MTRIDMTPGFFIKVYTLFLYISFVLFDVQSFLRPMKAVKALCYAPYGVSSYPCYVCIDIVPNT